MKTSLTRAALAGRCRLGASPSVRVALVIALAFLGGARQVEAQYRVTLESCYNTWVSCQPGGEVHVDRNRPFRWEQLAMDDLSGGMLWSGDTVTLRSWTGKYLCADYSRGNIVIANRDAAFAWEHFRVWKVWGAYILTNFPIFPGDQVALQASSGQWLTADFSKANNQMMCDRWGRGLWETFTMGWYRPDLAVNYAYQYAQGHNSAYAYYPYYFGLPDCTNFAGQTLVAGGWQMVWGPRPSTRTWFYAGFPWQNSYTWGAAANLDAFLAQGNRGYGVGSAWDLELGDIIVADWGGGDGWSHTMIITGWDWRGPLVSYHTPNTQNRAFRDVLNEPQNSRASYHYWHIQGGF